MHQFWPNGEPQPLHAIADADKSTGKRATMRIFDPIDPDGAPWGVSAKDVAAALDSLPDSVETIELHINSPGGHATDSIAILNAFRQHPAKVEVIVDGLAASAASVIAMCGDSVSMSPNAMFMVHDASAMAFGQAATMRMAADMLDKISNSIADVYAKRAGGTADEWRQVMQPGLWYTAEDAVAAGLADRVLPEGATAEQPTARFDLSAYADARHEPFIPAARAAHKPPAEPPEHHHPKGADLMSDTGNKALRERLGLGDDADVSAAAVARIDELEQQVADKADPPEITEEQAVAVLAKAKGIEAAKVQDAVAVAAGLGELKAPEGKRIISDALFEELQANSALGAEARAKQLEQERDDAIEAAFKAGKISAERRDHWKAAWDKDPEGTKADLESLQARFPVGAPNGYAGHDGSAGDGVHMSDDEAGELAAIAGVSKEALTR